MIQMTEMTQLNVIMLNANVFFTCYAPPQSGEIKPAHLNHYRHSE